MVVREFGDDFGSFLRQLRAKSGLTLREVEEQTNNAISNAYLSQVEGNKRPPPKPAILVALARVYGVSTEDLFERAGYSDAPTATEIDVAYDQVLADKTFQFGTRNPGELNQDAKRMIVELYERATKKTLLPTSESED
jgi:transcriptional regulator with XRE-family HTH domain